ncbi:hypothetical protein I3760_01G073100 [Carya illinoinensis]|nr:hypothetical protein I3760_01G073100 [Carya illinoinensis]
MWLIENIELGPRTFSVKRLCEILDWRNRRFQKGHECKRWEEESRYGNEPLRL